MANLIDRLPVELLVQVFSYLDSAAPSTEKARKEPSLDITTSPHHILKNTSRTSRRWRKIVLPLLFRDSCIRLSEEPSKEAVVCPVCNQSNSGNDDPSKAISYDIDAYHWALFSHAKEEETHDTPNPIDNHTRNLTVQWAGRMYHALKDYLHFLTQNDLTQHIQSLVLSTSRMLPPSDSSDRFPHYQARSDYRYRASAELWHHIFSTLGLSRVIIVACPSDMACLTNCAIDMFGDWAFSDMEYHLLELIIDSGSTKLNPIPPVDYASLSGIPEVYPGIAPSSILKLRPWSSLALNEGSFLKGYATYEYFERGPPSLIYSIKDLLASNRRAFHPRSQGGMDLRSLRKFTYTAILPFATHMDFRGLLPYIDELDVKLAPDVDSHILDDKERVGTAQLDDCWQELFTAYRLIIRPFRTFDIRPDGSPKLKRFICRDMMHPGLRDDLDDEFIALCLPVWAEMSTPGVFERQADVPHLPVDEFAQ